MEEVVPEFKFEIGKRFITYNHMIYGVEVDADHAVWWAVFPLASMHNGWDRLCFLDGLAHKLRLTGEVDKDPEGAIRWAHESARAWIDNYVETHLKLQKAVEEVQTIYIEEQE